jgi:hypothetical protein
MKKENVEPSSIIELTWIAGYLSLKPFASWEETDKPNPIP